MTGHETALQDMKMQDMR